MSRGSIEEDFELERLSEWSKKGVCSACSLILLLFGDLRMFILLAILPD